jgi:CHAD domain-containing protein
MALRPASGQRAAAALRPVKAARVKLATGASVVEAFAAPLRACLAQMRANEQGLLAGRNPEFLHQFRVGLRRLRLALRTYRPLLDAGYLAVLSAEISWLAAQLGGARDWDVLLGEILAPLARRQAGAPGLAALRRRCAEQRRAAAGTARAAVAADRYAALMRELEQLADAPPWRDDARALYLRNLPLSAFAAKRLASREKAVRRLAVNPATADAEQRHCLRIATKKLRYTLDFFDALFPRKRSRAYAAALSAMQDSLGMLNDCATARRLLGTVAAGRDAVADAAARGLVLGWIAAQEHYGINGLAAGYRAWRAHKRYWKAAIPDKPPAAPDNAPAAAT